MADEQSQQNPQRIEVLVMPAEVMKISPQPGDTLFFKFKGPDFYNEDVNNMGAQLRKLFPNNKVVVMALPDGHDVELTTIENQGTVEPVVAAPEVKDCSKPTDYCNSCGCGKKERIEAERNGG